MPALTSPGAGLAGLLEELEHRAVGVAADQAVGGGVLDRVAGRAVARAPRSSWAASSASGRGR